MKAKLKPQLTHDAKADVKASLENVIANLLEDHTPIYRSCLNCEYFNEGPELCMKAKPEQRPPARIIAYGCPGWNNFDNIPF